MTPEEIKELILLSKSPELKKDMQALAALRHNPFIRNNEANADAYIEFVTQYNEFITHQPKPFVKIIDRCMKI